MKCESRKIDSETDISDIVVRIDANGIGLEVERKIAALGTTKLVLVEVWPAPDPGVDDVGKAFPASDLMIKIELKQIRRTFFSCNSINFERASLVKNVATRIIKLPG